MDKGDNIPPKVKKVINIIGVACVNASWIIAPLTRQPKLRRPWAKMAKVIGIPLMVGGGVIGWSSTRDRKIIGVETPDSLVTEGMYRYMRHPTYAALLAGSLGWTLFRGAPYATAALPPLALGILAAGLYEEGVQLKPLFGEEYEEYVKKTPFFPRSLTVLLAIIYLLSIFALNERFLSSRVNG